MRITILYDNETLRPELSPDWGFSCLVEAHGVSILFDTGAKGEILLSNMDALNISPAQIDEVFISHEHWDHVGGLPAILAQRPCPVYLPVRCPAPPLADKVLRVPRFSRLHDGIYTTGTLGGVEQSLVVETTQGAVVVVGCSHPGVAEILQVARQAGSLHALVGGMHGFADLALLAELQLICPLHCTKRKREIVARYPHSTREGGAGLTLDWQGA